MSRVKKALSINVPTAARPGAQASAALKHQSFYGQEPWKPGEIPAMRNGTRIINVPLDIKAAPYREFFEVEKPQNRGKGYELKMDVEGNETEFKRGRKV